jgi:putative sterol carrier protein
MNQVVTKVPFGDGTIHSHLDTSSGEIVMDLGHLENPDLVVTTDYETARTIFIGQDPQAGMQAFLSGKVKVQGDMTKMMLMQTTQQPDDELAKQIAAEIQAITA